MKIKPLLVITAAAISLVGCAGNANPAPTVTVTETVTATPSEEPSAEATPEEEAAAAATSEEQAAAAPGIYSMGERAENFGVEVTFKKASLAKTIPLNKTNYRAGSGYETYTDEKPAKGGKFLVVEASVKNIGKKSMDLTCGWPIEIKAGDTDERVYDTIDSLYEYRDNPECNAQLQPGFTDEITYIFMAPKEAELTGVVFRDTNNSDFSDFTGVRFDKPLK